MVHYFYHHVRSVKGFPRMAELRAFHCPDPRANPDRCELCATWPIPDDRYAILTRDPLESWIHEDPRNVQWIEKLG